MLKKKAGIGGLDHRVVGRTRVVVGIARLVDTCRCQSKSSFISNHSHMSSCLDMHSHQTNGTGTASPAEVAGIVGQR